MYEHTSHVFCVSDPRKVVRYKPPVTRVQALFSKVQIIRPPRSRWKDHDDLRGRGRSQTAS
jgi:hypothetical protein